jgi:hypothetical protein
VLDKLTLSDFEAHIESAFPIDLPDDGPVELRLIEARAVGTRADRDGGREPFSLIFLGPDRPMLEQRIYSLMHPTIGRLEVFLVPIGPASDRPGLRYQAIFT